jgi:hypothetical protein
LRVATVARSEVDWPQRIWRLSSPASRRAPGARMKQATGRRRRRLRAT